MNFKSVRRNPKFELLEHRQLLAADCLSGQTLGADVTHVEQLTAASAAQAENLANVQESTVTLDLPSDLPEQFTTTVEFAGETLTLNLDKNSVFGENTRILVDDGSGNLVQIDPGVDRSYLGAVAEYPQYAVSAVLTTEGLRANIIRPNQPSIIVEPTDLLTGVHTVSLDEAVPASYDQGHDHDGDGIQDHAPEDHVYETGGGHPPGCTCAACCGQSPTTEASNASLPDLTAAIATDPPTRVLEVREYEIGVEIGSAALNNNYSGSTTAQKIAHATSVAQGIPGNLDARFLHSAGIKHRLGTLIIRTTSDPFTVSNGNDTAGLAAFRNYWNDPANLAEVGNTHDLAVYHVRSGPSGLAYVNSVGTSNRYALSASNGPTSWADGTLAHEFGHSWNLGHVPSGLVNATSFYEARPRNNGNASGGNNFLVSIMHGGGNHNIGRLSTGEANRVLDAKNNSLSVGDLITNPTQIKPFGQADFAVSTGSPITIDVIANDYDANNDVLDVQLRDTVSFLGGTISISNDTGPGGRDEIIYTPPGGVSGEDFFHYNVIDSTGRRDWGAVQITIDNPTVSVDLEATRYDYDLGTAGSPVFGGWVRISPDTTGDITWSTSVSARDRGATPGVNDINRDHVFSTQAATLNHKIANGIWEVLLNMGDTDAAHDQMGVRAEGQLISNNITSPAGQFSYVTTGGGSATPGSFQVQVTDGELNLEFFDNGGSDDEWVLTRATFIKVAEAPVTVDLNQTEYRYDLGTLNSPVFDSTYERLTHNVSGDISWTGAVNSADRGADVGTNDINRDIVYSTNGNAAVLEHKIANGVWQVLVNVGDRDNVRDDVGVRAEGTTFLSGIDRGAGEYNPNEIFEVFVEDGGLTLEFFDDGGANNNWSITRILLTRIGDLPTSIGPGDFKVDGQIDGEDLTEWQSDYGLNSDSDADEDGDSDGFDFLTWQRNNGAGVVTVTPIVDAAAGNGSFEDHTGSTGLAADESLKRAYSIVGTPATIPSWTLDTSFGVGGWESSDVNVSSDGAVYAFADDSSDVTLTSDVITGYTAIADDVFTLKFDTGSSNGAPHIYEARLKFGSTTYVLGSITDSHAVTGDPNENLLTRTFEHAVTPNDIGLSPVIEIFMNNQGGISRSYLDNIVLTASQTAPPPSSGLTAAVQTPIEELEEPAAELQALAAPIEEPVLLTGLQQLAFTSQETQEEPLPAEPVALDIVLSSATQFSSEDLQLLASAYAASPEHSDADLSESDEASVNYDDVFDSVFDLI